MAASKDERFQRGLNFAIVDEVDSILIDEARTPLIISGPADESPELYAKVNAIVPKFIRQEKEDTKVITGWMKNPNRSIYPNPAWKMPN